MSDPKRQRINRLFYRTFKVFINGILRLKYRNRYSDPDRILDLAPPYILLGNHVNFWDPFFIGVSINHIIQYVSTDIAFRGGITKRIMHLCGVIPKTKFMPDIKVIAMIIQAVRNGSIIGLFPEGRRSWDGRTIPMVPGTANLVKRLHLPVVVAHTVGGYLSQPRWARGARLGRVEVQYRLLYRGPELKRMSLDEVKEGLQRAIEFDDVAYNRTQGIRFRGRHRAEWLERVLFICRECEAIGSLRSEGAVIGCGACGLRIHYTEGGVLRRLSPQTERLPDEEILIADWNSWQIERLRHLLSARLDYAGTAPFFEDAPARLLIGYRDRPTTLLDSGSLALFPNAVVFLGEKTGERRLNMKDIQGTNVQLHERLEFYYHQTLYQFEFLDMRVSAYKWFKTIEIAQSLSG